MTLRFFETSALGGAFFADERDHAELLEALLSTTTGVVISTLVRLEFVSTCGIVARGGRIKRPEDPIDRLDMLIATEQLGLVDVDLPTILPSAESVVRRWSLRTLDALHLATAVELQAAVAGDDLVVEFVTRDRAQADAARAVGLVVA